jgi:hypothetical protein
MTNFKFFCKHSLKWLYIPWLPKIVIIEKREDENYLKAYSDAWAYYDSQENRIVIIREYDHPIVRLHEYGHWLNARLYMFLDALWEFPWWGLGLRELIRRKRS